jgi:uncharacterized RDD family membrane protein YckC
VSCEEIKTPPGGVFFARRIPHLLGSSPTIVDREQAAALDVAGPGSRSYAFIIDWEYRVLLALAWFCGAWLLSQPTALPLQAAVVPALAIYLLYHPVLEVLMHGRTPGKRRAGVRIVMRDGSAPDVGALLIRNAMRLLDSLPLFYVVGLVSCLITTQRVRIGDLAAGTVLVHDGAAAEASRAQLASLGAQSGLSAPLVELTRDVLERWPRLEVSNRDALARSILSRIDSAASAEQLATMSDAELLQRLRQLLGAALD